MTTTIRRTLAALLLLGSATFGATAQEAAIRKSLSERIPNFPKIDEVSRTPVAGIWEVRYGGTEILYTDATGEHILTGPLIDVKTRTDLTDARLQKLMAIDFADLPLADAVVIKQGSGARRLAVFVDPNCGYCKRFERDLAGIKDVTVYTFLLPILGPDSATKSRDVWCARDAGKAWRAWMLDNTVPPKSASGCDAKAVERNLAFGKQHKINGTPALIFEDGTRRPGALSADTVEKLLAVAAAPKKP